MENEKVFIFDCLGNIAGNPKGYRNCKQAERQASMRGSKAFNQIWEVFNIECDRLDKEGAPASGRLIYSCKPVKKTA